VEEFAARLDSLPAKDGFSDAMERVLAGARLDAIRAMLLEPRSLDRGIFPRARRSTVIQEHRAQTIAITLIVCWPDCSIFEWWHRVALRGAAPMELGERR